MSYIFFENQNKIQNWGQICKKNLQPKSSRDSFFLTGSTLQSQRACFRGSKSILYEILDKRQRIHKLGSADDLIKIRSNLTEFALLPSRWILCQLDLHIEANYRKIFIFFQRVLLCRDAMHLSTVAPLEVVQVVQLNHSIFKKRQN